MSDAKTRPVSEDGLKRFNSVMYRLGSIDMTPATASADATLPETSDLKFAYDSIGLPNGGGGPGDSSPGDSTTQSAKSKKSY
jgi:hypothetical protein